MTLYLFLYNNFSISNFNVLKHYYLKLSSEISNKVMAGGNCKYINNLVRKIFGFSNIAQAQTIN